MPYEIVEASEKGKKGYKVCKKDNPSKCFSNHPLSKEVAQKQRTAIILSELGRSSKSNKIHTGPRGGKYIIIGGNKRYL